MTMPNKDDLEFAGPPEWITSLREKLGWLFYSANHPFDTETQSPDMKQKLDLVYRDIISDLENSEAPEGIKEGLDPLPAMVGYLLAAMGGMALGAVVQPAISPFIQSKVGYAVNKVAKAARFDAGTILQLWLRKYPDEDGKEEWFSDLRDLGWSDERIDALKELAYILPSPTDVVTWSAREVFEPDAVEKYGLDSEFDKLDLSLFSKVGISKDMALNYWRAHWQHASWQQVVEMRRREILTDDDVWEWFRIVEIPPFWREKLMALIWEIPTRVDVRRWYDMRTIDETELRAIYGRQGYHGTDLDNYVLWTKVYTAFPDLIARYQKGWLTEDAVREELVSLGMPSERVAEMLETKIFAPARVERLSKERDLTKAEIVKGVKKNIISSGLGIQLLQDMGYEPWESKYIIDINIESQGSPKTPEDFEILLSNYKRSRGGKHIPLTSDILDTEKTYRSASQRLSDAEGDGSDASSVESLKVNAAEARMAYQEALRVSESDSTTQP